MTPIIPPIWLYLFEVLESLDGLLLAINIVGIATIIVYAIFAFYYVMSEGEAPPMPKKWVCVLICLVLVFSIIANILIPSQETMIYMVGLSFITHDNVEYGVEVVKNVFDYVITALDMGKI